MAIAEWKHRLIGAALLVLPCAALADVKDGVDAWEAGDYARAVAEWRGPAARGDADAQFDLAQAYRLGRGVEQDLHQAEVFYGQAAEQGHLKAADNLGLLLFQSGRREQAMPYVQAAAGRGDPRAQYLLGIAHFNGDLVAKDWPRAYALLTVAQAAGLPQAAPAIKQMDDYIPLEQRRQAQLIVPELKREADIRRATAYAADDLATTGAPDSAATRAPVVARAPVPAPARPAPVPVAPERAPVRVGEAPPPPPASVATPDTPSVAAARDAIAQAARVTGTQSPAEAGAAFGPEGERPAPAPGPQRVASPPPESRSASASAPAANPRPSAASGPWKVQLGAFAVAGNADRLWSGLSGRSELAGRAKLLERQGNLTRLLAGGYPSREAAQKACEALKRSGRDCLVTR